MQIKTNNSAEKPWSIWIMAKLTHRPNHLSFFPSQLQPTGFFICHFLTDLYPNNAKCISIPKFNKADIKQKSINQQAKLKYTFINLFR